MTRPAEPCDDRDRALKRDAILSVTIAAAALGSLGVALSARDLLGTAYPIKALAALSLAALPIAASLAAHQPHRRFGAANRVTLARLAAACGLFALLGEPPDALAWPVVAIATLAAAADGPDGALARRHGTSSPFGARFDMETDAWLILVLAALAWHWGKAGAWVLLCGLLRYVFVLAGWGQPWLAAPLAPSRRRQAVCVLQIATLIACLAPLLAPPWSGRIAALGLAALAASFALDIGRLARGRHLPMDRPR